MADTPRQGQEFVKKVISDNVVILDAHGNPLSSVDAHLSQAKRKAGARLHQLLDEALKSIDAEHLSDPDTLEAALRKSLRKSASTKQWSFDVGKGELSIPELRLNDGFIVKGTFPLYKALAALAAGLAALNLPSWLTLPQIRDLLPRAGSIRVSPADLQPYAWIPPGEFKMGCSAGDEECWDDEKPRHEVRITRGFWMGRTPVTVGAYRKFVEATNRKAPKKPEFEQTEEHPVVNVSWEEAKAYCEWAGGRLPAEAEWEYAARAGTTSARYGELDEIAWYGDNSGAKRIDSTTLWDRDQDATHYVEKLRENGNRTHAVGEKKANGFGLNDMLGNVWEWCADWFDDSYYKASPEEDPKGPEKGEMRVVRGGSWYVNPRVVRASYRDWYPPDLRFNNMGFRCVRDQIS